jgi:hypothetical protein
MDIWRSPKREMIQLMRYELDKEISREIREYGTLAKLFAKELSDGRIIKLRSSSKSLFDDSLFMIELDSMAVSGGGSDTRAGESLGSKSGDWVGEDKGLGI